MRKITHSVSTKEIFLWRLSNAVLWSVLMQVFFVWVYLCVLHFNLFHPIIWIKETFSLLTSLRTWLRLVPCGSVIFLQGVLCGKEYLNQRPTYSTRFSFFVHIFSIRNIILCSVHMLSGGLTVWLYLSMLGGHYSSLVKSCTVLDQSCFVEGNLFLLLSGFWNGLCYFVKDHIFTPTLVTFPPIQQRKFIQVKSSLGGLFEKAMGDSLLPVFSFAIFYYFEGYLFRNVVLSVLTISNEDDPVDNMFYMKAPSVIFYAWVFATLFLTTMYTMTLLFNVYLTEHHTFPIEMANVNSASLSESLMEGPEILNKLAAQDLMMMAYKDKVRRSIVFSLSQPGGHPTNWKNLSNKCLLIINSYCNDLNNIVGDNKPTEHNISPPQPIPKPDMIKSPRLRNLAMMSPKGSPMIDDSVVEYEVSISTALKRGLNSFLTVLCKKPGISYFFGEMTELKLKWIVLRGQLVSRVAQGLAQLASVSLAEDVYGVVQHDLAVIITSLVHLKQALDKLSKSGVANKRSLRQDTIVMQMLTELKSAVKRSIYKLTIHFGKYIKDIPLDVDTQIALQPFINLKEA